MSGALPSFCTAVRSSRHAIHNRSFVFRPDLLKDESSEIDLVGPTLPALKSLLDLPTASGSNVNEGYDRLVHALLSACLLHIDEMRYAFSSAKLRYFPMMRIQWSKWCDFCEENQEQPLGGSPRIDCHPQRSEARQSCSRALLLLDISEIDGCG
jgi:hypothetical protein